MFKNKNIFIPKSKDKYFAIYLDGLKVNKKSYLIASNGKRVIGFCFVDYDHQTIEEIFLKTLMNLNM